MNIKQWNGWQKSLPWEYRWFVLLILLRPLIDNFYDLKPVSPLVIVGILTPVLSLRTIMRTGTGNSNRMLSFSIFAFLTVLSALLMFLRRPGAYTGEIMLKVTLPVYMFYFLRRFIYNQQDLHGILYIFIVAAYIAGLLLMYEILFKPLQEVVYSRGMQRFRGGYADVMNYAIYMSLGMVASGYFHLKKISVRIFGIPNLYLFLVLATVIVVKINHVASYGVYAAIIIIFTLYALRKTAGFGLLLVLIVIGSSVYYGDKIFQERINPLIEKDISVFEGARDETMLLHGRVGRWERLWVFFSEATLVSKFIGTGPEIGSGYLMGSGTHNDFLRILFVSGLIGILAYLAFLFGIWRQSLRFDLPERFLALASLVSVAMYSITTTPTFYANFMYVFLTILVFFTLQPEEAYDSYSFDTEPEMHEEALP